MKNETNNVDLKQVKDGINNACSEVEILNNLFQVMEDLDLDSREDPTIGAGQVHALMDAVKTKINDIGTQLNNLFHQ